jgi:hypothetical protein
VRVLIYVEGPSDRRGLEVLLAPVISQKAQEGIAIEFFTSPPGDAKGSLLTKVPIKAVNILLNDSSTVVVAMPDLYPKHKEFRHETVQELTDGIYCAFDAAMQRKRCSDARIKDRFQVFCFKYEFEALLLAAEEGLRGQLGDAPFRIQWRLPVEDQNHDRPPKQVVKALFQSRGQAYIETYHAPLILAACRYEVICERCRQCFEPFVKFLVDLKRP